MYVCLHSEHSGNQDSQQSIRTTKLLLFSWKTMLALTENEEIYCFHLSNRIQGKNCITNYCDIFILVVLRPQIVLSEQDRDEKSLGWCYVTLSLSLRQLRPSCLNRNCLVRFLCSDDVEYERTERAMLVDASMVTILYPVHQELKYNSRCTAVRKKKRVQLSGS